MENDFCPQLSVIIPTHNRATFLETLIKNLLSFSAETDFELIIVDNNSSDYTREICEKYSSDIRYVFEKKTAFTAARNAGAAAARGSFLLFLDDDVEVLPGSFAAIAHLFNSRSDCGLIAGRVIPKYQIEPPKWTKACQEDFNGWSLFNENNFSYLKQKGIIEVKSAVGPMMAIRRDLYQKLGGFPPDTIGVETNLQEKSFRKLYVGPGDSGLSRLVINAGFKILYSSEISVRHIIPPIRMTVGFWRSRVLGEAHANAISDRMFSKLSYWRLLDKKLRYLFHAWRFYQKLSKATQFGDPSMLVSTDELWFLYYSEYLELSLLLDKEQGFAEFLWKIAQVGVENNQFDKVVKRFPKGYKQRIDSNHYYSEKRIASKQEVMELFRKISKQIQKQIIFLSPLFQGLRVVYFLKRKMAYYQV